MRHRTRILFLSGLAAAALCFFQAGCSSRGKEAPATPSPSPAAAQNLPTTTPAGAPTTAATSPAAPAPAEAVPKGATPPAAGSAASMPPPEKPAPRSFTLPAGSSVAVYTSSTLSTKSNKAGDAFTASLASPLSVGDRVLAKKGAAVEGVIVNSDPGGRVKGVASMTIQLKRLALADGHTVPISTGAYVAQAKSTKKKDAKKIGIGAGAGALIGAIAGGGKGAAIGAGVGGGAGTGLVLATHGDPAVVPSESRLNFKLKAPVTVTLP